MQVEVTRFQVRWTVVPVLDTSFNEAEAGLVLEAGDEETGTTADQWWEEGWLLTSSVFLSQWLPYGNGGTIEVVIAKITYASSSWWGFTNATDRQHLEGFLRRGQRQNLYSAGDPSLAQLLEEADENLFNNIRYNPTHSLHYLLPKQTEHSYSLRSRSHNFELSCMHDDRNFIDRMLFKSYHHTVLCVMCFCVNVSIVNVLFWWLFTCFFIVYWCVLSSF